MSKTKNRTVKETGAHSRDLLIGIERRNKNMLVEIEDSQAVGRGGRIIGGFTIRHAGDGYYSDLLASILNQRFGDSKTFIEELKRKNSKITHLINCNALRVHQD